MWSNRSDEGETEVLRIQRSQDGSVVTLAVSGRLADDYVAELKRVIGTEEPRRCVTLDLTEVTHVTREGVRLLVQLEADGVHLKACPEYLRHWISRQRD